MSAESRVYLTPEEAASGTTRMIRPAGGDWAEVTIPPTRHGALLRLSAGDHEVRIRVTVVPPGLSAPSVPVRSTWGVPVRTAVVLIVTLVCAVVVLLVLRGCTAGGTVTWNSVGAIVHSGWSVASPDLPGTGARYAGRR